MDLIWVKLLYLLAIVSAAWVGAIIILFINPKKIAWLSIGCCAAGGIFLAAGLVHLIPDARESLEKFHYPWGEVMAVIMFIFFLALEKVFIPESVHKRFHGHQHKQESQVLLGGGINDEEEEKPPLMSLRSIVLLIALGIHSILAGCALGVQPNLKHATSTFIAIISHKWSAAAALTVGLRKDQSPVKAILFFVLLFSLMTPAGIGIGMAVFAGLGAKAKAHHPVIGFLTAAAGGTFLYVSIVEILCVEFSDRQYKWPKLIATVLGAAFMCAIATFA